MGDRFHAAHESLLKQPASTVRLPALTRAVVLAVSAARNISFNTAMVEAATSWLHDQAAQFAPAVVAHAPTRSGNGANQPHAARGNRKKLVSIALDAATIARLDSIATSRGHSRSRAAADELRNVLKEPS
jgi:hypothetical protein